MDTCVRCQSVDRGLARFAGSSLRLYLCYDSMERMLEPTGESAVNGCRMPGLSKSRLKDSPAL
jgi:hypothetical protein